MVLTICVSKKNIRKYISCIAVHREKNFAGEAIEIMAKQWNHKNGEKARNLKSMTEDSMGNLPCHLALVFKPCIESESDEIKHSDCSLKTINFTFGEEFVVGHVKLTRADGRADGACCTSHSLVVAEEYRGLGLGRLLTEEAENYGHSLNMAYMYLSTNDKVEFYEHLGYKQCEPVSNLGSTAKLLSTTQVSSLEGLFAKRLNICNPTTCNTWLRKRLVREYLLKEPADLSTLVKVVAERVESLCYKKPELNDSRHYSGVLLRLPWQQQTGPSCGIAALNMVMKYLELCEKMKAAVEHDKAICNCIQIQPVENNDFLCSNQLCLDTAIQHGITNDGEMFCAYNLSFLCQQVFNVNLTVDDYNKTTSLQIWNSIRNGVPVLIPYDRCLNDHTPGLFEGAHAHWAVVIGVILPKSEHTNESHNYVHINEHVSLSLFDACGTEKEILNMASSVLNANNSMLICMHGMSSKPFVCTFFDMMRSNEQLTNSKSKFYLAAADLEHLRSKIVFVDC